MAREAGLTRAKVTRAPTDLIYANMPDYLLQLGTDYQLRRARAAVSGRHLTWQSAIEGLQHPAPQRHGDGEAVAQGHLNLRASWQFNPKLSATLRGEQCHQPESTGPT